MLLAINSEFCMDSVKAEKLVS